MNVVNVDGLVRKCAAGWNELCKADLLWLVGHMEHLLKPSYVFRIKLMLRLLNVQWWRFFSLRKLMRLPVEEVAYMSRIVDWVFPLDKVNLTTNFFKNKRVGFVKLIGPADKLANLTLAEFSFADRHFSNYMKTQDVNELNKLCAVLWRVPGKQLDVDDAGFKNDARISFNSYAINKNSLRFKFTSIRFKLFVLLYFWGCRNEFVKNYSHVFSGEHENKINALDLGWVNVMFELAGDKFGNLNETSEQALTTILLFLENSLINIKNQKE